MKRNNFAVARLVFAFLVILSHSAEIIDGDRHRELATTIWHTLSFGEIGVDGFFLVSGYLITQSFEQSAGFWHYMWKRVLRIYPAFLAAFFVCLLIVGPLAGATMPSSKQIAQMLIGLPFLQAPTLPNIFNGMSVRSLNGSMWSISDEFKCYVIIGLVGAAGLLRWRIVVALAAAILLTLNAFQVVPNWWGSTIENYFVGNPNWMTRLLGIFLSGASFYLFRDVLVYQGRLAAVAAVVLFVALYSHLLAEATLATLGGYCLFYLIFRAPAVGEYIRYDISYGLYLYAWPIQSLLIFYGVSRTPIVVTLLTTIAAALLGLASWLWVERPALSLKAWRPSHSAVNSA